MSKPSQKLAISPRTYRSSSKLPIYQPETQTNEKKTSNQPIESSANSKKLQESDRKLERTVENFKLSIKTRTNGGKWLHQHTTTQKLRKLQKLTLWMGTGFTRPHGGRLNVMILPVDQSARALPRQRYLLWIGFAPR